MADNIFLLNIDVPLSMVSLEELSTRIETISSDLCKVVDKFRVSFHFPAARMQTKQYYS